MSSETLVKHSSSVSSSVPDSSAVEIDACISMDSLRQSNIENAVYSLKESFIELSAKFDVWQSTTEPMLGQAYDISQTSMTYSTIILAVLGIVLAGAIMFVARNKKEAISQAIEEVREDIVKEVMNSEDFKKLVKSGVFFGEDSENAEKERASRDVLLIKTEDITTAENTDEDENSTKDIDNHVNLKQVKNVNSKGGCDECEQE